MRTPLTPTQTARTSLGWDPVPTFTPPLPRSQCGEQNPFWVILEPKVAMGTLSWFHTDTTSWVFIHWIFNSGYNSPASLGFILSNMSKITNTFKASIQWIVCLYSWNIICKITYCIGKTSLMDQLFVAFVVSCCVSRTDLLLSYLYKTPWLFTYKTC